MRKVTETMMSSFRPSFGWERIDVDADPDSFASDDEEVRDG